MVQRSPAVDTSKRPKLELLAVVFAVQARVASRHQRPTLVDRSIYFLINWQSLAHAGLFDLQGQKARMHYEYVLQQATPHKPSVTD